MPKPSDQPPDQPSTAHPTHAIQRVHLITMADRLDQDPERNPEAPFTAADRRTLADDVTGGYAALLLDFIPEVTAPITRGAYAARLREIGAVR
ncbi:hypothetical protein ACFXKC_17975 [Streptomyces sp. NPDC059340]|uniref:hypothetical protein n=1 Tax=Streptomyces sp. NPDC059340 TaxID=3346806 RepID=UPI0036B99E7B